MEPSTKFHVSSELTLVFVFFFTILILTSLSFGVLAERDNDPGKFFSQYPGARESSEISQTLITFWEAISSGGDTEKIEFQTYTTPDPPDKVIDHYKNQEPGNGWNKTLQLPGGGESMIIAWKRNGEALQLVIGEDEGKTFILFGYGKKSSGAESNWVFYTEDDGLINDRVTVMEEGRDGSVWCGTSSGLMRFVNGTWKAYTFGPLSNGIKDIAVADNGDLWVGTWTKGLMYYDGSIWKSITKKDGLVNNRISSIAIGNDGKVSVSSLSRRGGISFFDGDNWETYTEEEGLPSNYVYSLTTGPDNELWVGTKKGLALLKEDNWTVFTQEDGLLDNEIEEVEIDIHGNVWTVSDEGVVKSDGGEFRPYPYGASKISQKVFQIKAASDGRVWFATKGGIICFEGDKWLDYSEEEGLPGSYILSLMITSKDKIWVGSISSGVGVGEII